MRGLTESLINRLAPKKGNICIDLTCGTGFATNLIAEKTQNTVIGVDSSEGMLTQARKNYDHNCKFIQADILEYLKKRDSSSVDIVACCWGLGYSKPFAVLRQIKRILKLGGKVTIIDNSLFSLREIIYCSFLTFAEQPEKFVLRERDDKGRKFLCESTNFEILAFIFAVILRFGIINHPC